MITLRDNSVNVREPRVLNTHSSCMLRGGNYQKKKMAVFKREFDQPLAPTPYLVKPSTRRPGLGRVAGAVTPGIRSHSYPIFVPLLTHSCLTLVPHLPILTPLLFYSFPSLVSLLSLSCPTPAPFLSQYCPILVPFLPHSCPILVPLL